MISNGWFKYEYLGNTAYINKKNICAIIETQSGNYEIYSTGDVDNGFACNYNDGQQLLKELGLEE